MAMIRTAVIMAGGSGERFWPLSRRSRPKQLLRLTAPDRSLLQEAVRRILPLIPPERVFIVTGKHLVDPIRKAQPGVPPENVLAEPLKRNTSGCLVFAAAAIPVRLGLGPEAVTMAVLTADHRIGDDAGFRRTVQRALDAAETTGALGTIGIRPTRPETGYGYIETPAAAQPAAPGVLPVVRFHEKPDIPTARRYLEAGRFLWNSGMFFWKVSVFLAELEQADPAFARIAGKLRQALEAGRSQDAEKIFAAIPGESIDYALMEKARNVVVAPADFDWDDIGAWDALDRTMARSEQGNVLVGDPVVLDTRDSIVYNEPGSGRCAVGVLGLDGVVVVVAGDAVLVMPKHRAQDVRRVVAELKRRGASQL